MSAVVGAAPGAGAIAIHAGAEFEGLLSFEGSVQVLGQLEGRVVARGRLEIGAGARVRARVEVDELYVAGSLEGDVVVRDRVELAPTARVAGTLSAARFQLAEGCRFEGRCETRRPGVEPARKRALA